MDTAGLIEALKNASAYPYTVDDVEVRQTHISAVFLAGRFAYKIKKPLNLGFLDFSTLERRRHFCAEEVRLNRRLAPAVYLGVVPIVRAGQGLKLEGTGDAVEWAVKMVRLPEEATLEKRLQRADIPPETVRRLAGRIAAFHAGAARGPHIAGFGRFPEVARNARENFEQARPLIGTTVSQAVFDRLQALTEQTLSRLHPLMEDRAERGMPCDTHGDLHLDHVYFFPEQQPPADLVIVDCIEFNERFRYADPVGDMAFLVMDFLFHGRPDLARVFADAYFEASGDSAGRSLLPFYTAYRAAIRGKVEGISLVETEFPEEERTQALTRARAHWLLALGQLETPERRPCLVMVGGLPGTGKSTLARMLADRAGFRNIHSDIVRKELAGLSSQDRQPAAFEQGIYSPEWTERTYQECLARADRLLFDGERVLVDASFREVKHRQAFFQIARRWSVPACFLHCQADPEHIRSRLQARRGDVSDADWAIYQEAALRWEGTNNRADTWTIHTSDDPEAALGQAMAALDGYRER